MCGVHRPLTSVHDCFDALRRAERFGTPFVEPSKRADGKKKPKGGKDKQKKDKWQKGKNQNAGYRGGVRAPLVRLLSRVRLPQSLFFGK